MPKRQQQPGKVSRAWNSRPTFIGAAVVVGVAVIVMVLAGINAATGGHTAQQTQHAAAPSASTTTGGGCNVPVGSTSTTPAMPRDLTWKTGVDGLTWPTSKAVGPTSTNDGFDVCFARSPLGAALFATTAIYSQYDGKHTVQSALGFYIESSPGKAANIAATAKEYDPQQMRNAGMNPSGFVVDSFNRSRAQITLVYSYPSSSTGYVGEAATAVWVDGDWKLSVLDDGELSSGNATTPSAGTFTTWSGATS